MAAKNPVSAKVNKPRWETEEEYFQWARAEARIQPLTFAGYQVNNAGSRVVVDNYHGHQNEDDA